MQNAIAGIEIMDRVKLIMALLMGFLISAWGGVNALWADQAPLLTVHFEPGKAFLSDADKSELRRFFESYTIGPQGRVFVVGYTDGTGTKTENHKLSRQRAETVRREIIDAFGIDAGIVMALGKAADIPLADNKTAKGRALNRRAEIYLANGQARKPQRPLGPDDPYWSDIQNLVRDAEEMIKERRLESALLKLRKAHALGADRYSDWHAVFGIAGYYTCAPPEETRAHLVAALDLDPYNFKAREYLSRMDARQKVSRAEVTKDMGRTIETAIGITAIAQQYEYLRLFEVEPLVHRQLETHPVDMWQCVDKQGAPVVYFFNHASAYQWAFAQAMSGTASPVAQAVRSSGLVQEIPSKANVQTPPPGKSTARTHAQNPGKIWESKIFK
jgi:hypothetical protein